MMDSEQAWALPSNSEGTGLDRGHMSHEYKPRAGPGPLDSEPLTQQKSQDSQEGLTPHPNCCCPPTLSPVTFHPDEELAQVDLQGPLNEPHVLQSPTQGSSAPAPRDRPRGHTETLPYKGPRVDRCFLRAQDPRPPKLGPAGALPRSHCLPTSVHSCRLRPSSCRLSREARLGGHREKARCMLEAPSRRRHWMQ